MKSSCAVLIVAIIQGAIGWDEVFSVEPRAENIVPFGSIEVLECVTKVPSICAWRLQVPGLGTAFFTNHPNQQASAGEPAEPEDLEAGLGIFDRVRDLDIRVHDPTFRTDCTIVIVSVEVRHSGTYTCAPSVGGRLVFGTPAEIIVTRKPDSVAFTGDLLGATELTASATEPTTVTCEARDGRPSAELSWYLGDRQLTDGVVPEEETNPDTQLVTSRSTLTHQFVRQDEGATLRCRASHPVFYEHDQHQATLSVLVQFAPYRAEGSDVGTLYGFTEGEDKDLTVHFTSNPAPTTIQWMVGADATLAEGEQTADGRIIAGPLETVDAETHQYSLRLTFSPVKAEDRNIDFRLLLANEQGHRQLKLRVDVDTLPLPPTSPTTGTGVSGGVIAGIIVPVVVLLAVIALVAFAHSRGKWCFATKTSDAAAEALQDLR